MTNLINVSFAIGSNLAKSAGEGAFKAIITKCVSKLGQSAQFGSNSGDCVTCR